MSKRKKSTRMRGKTTHGYGSMKKNRGAGNRGGKGFAGSGKRSDSKKPSTWKYRYFGKLGFTSVKKRGQAISLGRLNDALDSLVEKKLVEMKGDVYAVDLQKIGFNKLLGTGSVSRKVELNGAASARAVEKIQAAGGSVIGGTSVDDSSEESSVEDSSNDASAE